MENDVALTGNERVMRDDDIIVSKTDLGGRIQYGNDIFCEIADYTVKDIMGQPHSILRNPNMPRCVFKLLWDRIQAGEEIFAYVVNKTKGGDHYWVLAHVTPSFDENGNVQGYHSNRRKPTREAINAVSDLYKQLLDAERKGGSKKEGMEKSMELLESILEEKGVSYDEFILSV